MPSINFAVPAFRDRLFRLSTQNTHLLKFLFEVFQILLGILIIYDETLIRYSSNTKALPRKEYTCTMIVNSSFIIW